jgi:DNA-binding transcriptional LysR family regulator
MYHHQLDAFLRVAELGSFSKAAEAMFISPPAIIKQINLLESRCGFQLLFRSNHGVKLTPAGGSLYEDAKTLIRLSEDALTKARQLAEASETTVRVGTSLLFKCRYLPDVWAKVAAVCPELRIELVALREKVGGEASIAEIGVNYDLKEGIFCTISQAGRCGFLELMRTPICCAVSKSHRLAGAGRLTMDDLNGEYLMMPIQGVSQELDDFRVEVTGRYPTVQIIDSSYYGVDTFTLCEMNPYILITQPVYSDIHTNLVSIPLETDYTLPYGLIYSLTPSPAVQKFIRAAEKVTAK